jgi:ATP-binding cassette, subfamily F, member 3
MSPMIKVANLTKTYGSQVLFDSASFNINSQERVGLVGRNGHGKSTLFRLLLGQEEPDSGQIVVPRHYSIGHLAQHLHFTQPTVRDEACQGLPADLQHDAWRVEKILSGLGFAESDLDRAPAEFSGGFQIRLNLAKVLVSDPDLLLLDEPTNYLDIVSIRWLIKFLNGWKKELLLITHDRSFMDSVTTHTMGIHRCKIRKLAGGTEKYYSQLAQDEEVYEKTRLNDEKKRQEIERFITRFRAKARLAGLAQSRMKALEKMEKRERLTKIENLDFEFSAEEFPAKVMLAAEELAFAYPGQLRPLIEHLSFTLEKTDRIGVIGKNGKGKSTLLRLLIGELTPVHGEVKRHPRLSTAYFGQTNIDRLDNAKTVEEEIMDADPNANRRKARDICGAMMFSGDAALKKVSVLSGGERSRVLLGKLLLAPAHLLVLDEPTNHLDLDSSEALLEAINAFPNAAIIVTHNEDFLHALINKFVVFDQDRVFTYTGSYQNFLDDVGWEDEAGAAGPRLRPAPPAADAPAEPDAAPAAGRKQARQVKAAVVQEKTRVLKPLEIKIKEMEKSIERLEAEKSRVDQAMIQASIDGDAPSIAALPKQARDLEQQLEFLYGKLDLATREFEKKKAEFEAKLR